jgi:hypothetical protein
MWKFLDLFSNGCITQVFCSDEDLTSNAPDVNWGEKKKQCINQKISPRDNLTCQSFWLGFQSYYRNISPKIMKNLVE